MKRVATVLAAATALLPAAPALAGGPRLETERPFYRPGEMASGRAVFEAPPSAVRDGPYRAYLVEEGDWVAPGKIHRRATPVGPMRIARAGGRWRAAVRFAVPDLEAGEYWLDYCNVPCRVEGVGDLDGAPVLIGASEREALLGRRLQRAERRTERLERRLDRELAARFTQPDEQMRAETSPIEPAAEERAAGLLPLAAGIAAGLLLGMVVRRRPRVVALVPYDPLLPPASRRSTRRRLR